MNQTSPYGPPIPNGYVSNKGDRFCQDGTFLLYQGRLLQVSFPGQGTDQKRLSFPFYIIQILDPVDIHEDLWSAEPEVHDGHQALTASKDLRFIFVLLQ